MGSITRVGCFAHVRRKFRDGIPKTATTSKSQCEIGKSYCDQLFGIERKIAYLIPEERLEKLIEQALPVLDELSSGW